MSMEKRTASRAFVSEVEIQLSPQPQQAQAAFCPTSRRSSIDSHTSIMSIEPLHDIDDDTIGGSEPGARMPRRRSSNISFEKHNSVVLERLVSLVDDDDSDDEGSLDGIPTASEAPDNPNEPSNTTSRQGQGQEELLVDFGNLSQVSVESLVAGRRRRRSSASTSIRSSFPILGRIEDEIIEKGIRQGKLVPAEREDTARIGHESINSINSSSSSSSGPSAARRRGSLGRTRASFVRRASASSALSDGSRRVSFGGSGGGSFRAGPSLYGDIASALRGLDNVDMEDEEDDDAAIARAVQAMGTNLGTTSAASRCSLTVEVEMAVPPRRDTKPRRSSMKRPESRRDWS